MDFYPNNNGNAEMNTASGGMNTNGGRTTASPSVNMANISQNPPPAFEESQAYQGSWQQILNGNIGEYVVIEFLIGTQEIVSRQGILYAVGVNYVVLYEEQYSRYVVCDLYSIKFATFYEPGVRPRNQTTRR